MPLIHETFRRATTASIRLPADRSALRQELETLQHCLSAGSSIHAGREGVSCASDGAKANCQTLLCQSSGTSSQAKTIKRSPASWIRSFEVNRKRFSLAAEDRYAVLGALNHSLTLYGMLEACHIGCDVHVLTSLLPRHQLEQLALTQTTVVYATPTQLRLILEGANAVSLPSLRLILSGGGKLDAVCRAGLKTLCPNAAILEFYGASETSFITLSDAATPAGSVGQAYPGVALEVRDANGHITSGEGEIWVSSPYLFDGYAVGDSSDTRWHDGFLTVGEMGYVDENGNLFLRGRKSRMVTVADQNVFLEDVEAVLQQQGPVRHATAHAIPDAKRGHIIVAIIEVTERDELASQLQTECRIALGTLASPRQIFFIDSMPLLPSGKPDLRRLDTWLEDQL